MSKHTRGPWYVGTQNDTLFIINRPPRPSNDDINLERDVEIIAKVCRERGEDFEKQAANARRIVACVNILDGIPAELLEKALSCSTEFARVHWLAFHLGSVAQEKAKAEKARHEDMKASREKLLQRLGHMPEIKD